MAVDDMRRSSVDLIVWWRLCFGFSAKAVAQSYSLAAFVKIDFRCLYFCLPLIR